MNRFVILLLSIITIHLSGCQTHKNASSSQALTSSKSHYDFYPYGIAQKLYDGSSNFVYSPASLSIALNLVSEFADQTSANRIGIVMGMNNYDEFCNHNQKLSFGLNNRKNNLEINNSVWIDHSKQLPQTSVQRYHEKFDAEVNAIDFSSNHASDTINDWISEKTHQLIPGVFEPNSPLTQSLICINAIFLKSKWTFDFEKVDDPTTFHNIDSTTTVS